MVDVNDAHKAGTLPTNHEHGAEPMPPPPHSLDALAPPLRAWRDDALERLHKRRTGQVQPIPVPWAPLASKLDGGLWDGLYVLVGNTKSGKSQLAIQLALNALHAGFPVLYVALELSRHEVLARLVAAADGALASSLMRRSDDEQDELRAVDRMRTVLDALGADPPFHVMSAPNGGQWSHEHLLPAVRAMTQRHGQRPLVVVDYLQLVGGPERELRERMSAASAAGRRAAMECDATVVMLSSTARTNYAMLAGRGEGPQKLALGKSDPTMLVGVGKESGDIEHNVDALLVLTRAPWPEPGDKPPPGGTHSWLAIAASRYGEPGWVELRFNGARFTLPELKRPAGFKL